MRRACFGDCLSKCISADSQVIVVDEIGNAKEVAAIKDIAQIGVVMVATVHGTTLQHLLDNPVLNPLVGGKQRMVIGDFAAQ